MSQRQKSSTLLVPLFAALAATFLTPIDRAAAADGIVASIKPVHSLVAGVMKGVGEPELLIGGAQSPHTWSMKPSQAQSLQNAKAIFWIGEGIETPLAKPIATIAKEGAGVELMDTEGLTLHPLRGDHDGHDHGGSDDHADHDDHGHDEHKEAKADDHDDHDHSGHDHDDHGHDDHKDEHSSHDHDDHGHDDHKEAKADDHDDHAGHGHAEGEADAHIWLSPDNAKLMLANIVLKLTAVDPDNGPTYKANADAMIEKINAAEDAISEKLKAVADSEVIVFHDAYQYFEKSFGLKPAHAVVFNPEVTPGAARITELKEEAEELKIKCIFAEPQFDGKILKLISEQTGQDVTVIDPLGADLEAGPELYTKLINNMADAYSKC